MRQVSSTPYADIARHVDMLHRRHGREGLLILIDVCHRALRTAPAADTVERRRPVSLVGP